MHNEFFYISTGEGRCLYTLRHCWSENRGTYIARFNQHWVNLARDFEVAKQKAQTIIDRYNAGGNTTIEPVKLLKAEEIDLNAWGSAGIQKWYDDPRTKEEQAFDDAYREAWQENIARNRAKWDAERRARREASEFVGEVKERLNFALTVVNTYTFDSQWGPCTIFILEDKDGNAFKYKGSCWLGERGDQVRLVATIKSHDVYTHNQYNDKEEYDQKQTVLTRPKVSSIVTKEQLQELEEAA